MARIKNPDGNGQRVVSGMAPAYYTKVTVARSNPTPTTSQEDYEFFLLSNSIKILRLIFDTSGNLLSAEDINAQIS